MTELFGPKPSMEELAAKGISDRGFDDEIQRLPAGRHGLSTEEVQRHQRERMLEAMIRAVAEKGYDAVVVADVIDRARVSRRTYYEMFEDKDDCFLAAYDTIVEVLVRTVETAYRNTDGTWAQRVHAGLAALAKLLAEEADLARVGILEIQTGGPRARQRYRDALGRFMPFLDEGRAHSKFAAQLPANNSRIAVGGVAALLVEAVKSGRTAELEQMIPDLVFAALMPFLGREAAEEEMRAAVPSSEAA